MRIMKMSELYMIVLCVFGSNNTVIKEVNYDMLVKLMSYPTYPLDASLMYPEFSGVVKDLI